MNANDKQRGHLGRLVRTPVEGRLVHGLDGIDVGNRIRVELISIDVERGYIDFGKVGPSRN
jgi:ribonuclease R